MQVKPSEIYRLGLWSVVVLQSDYLTYISCSHHFSYDSFVYNDNIRRFLRDSFHRLQFWQLSKTWNPLNYENKVFTENKDTLNFKRFLWSYKTPLL